MRNTLIIILASFGLLACKTEENKQEVAEWPHAVTYEIFVQSFNDSNGDGIGDINGMTAKLDYLAELGVKGVWLMPIMPSPSYHKYDVTDYRDIHPDYGTLDDFKNFVTKAHEKGIHVVIDLVINHSSSLHPWFIESRKGPDNPYRDYYVWKTEEEIENLDPVEKGPDSDNPIHWHENEGDDYRYYGYFIGGMPDLNFHNPKVKEEIYDIGRFWLEEVGVDGFRLDAARHIFDENAEDNHEFWVEFRAEMEKVKPDVYLVGEVWSDVKSVAPYLKGIPALFNFDMGMKILEVVNTQDEAGLPEFHHYIQNYYDSVNNEFIDATFITNHDQNRGLSEFGGDINKGKLAASILMTLPGSPYLYYGEEIGMLGQKPDEQIREPYLWANVEQDSGRPKWETPVYSTDETVIPLAGQQDNPASLYNHYKQLINYRNTSAPLTYGEIIPTGLKMEGLTCWYRVHESDTLLVLHNLTGKELLVKNETLDKYQQDMVINGAVKLEDQSISMGPYTSAVLKQ